MRPMFFSLWQKRGLCFLLGMIGFIWVVSLQPGFFIIGWDNFSSYFNLPENIFRTFFATWRAYRGLGVASDSEATDVFRQLFYFLLVPLAGESLTDQVYVLAALSVGLIAMYFLARQLFFLHAWSNHPDKLKRADLFAFFAAFFYLCNLTTVATFTFPMVMYTNRF